MIEGEEENGNTQILKSQTSAETDGPQCGEKAAYGLLDTLGLENYQLPAPGLARRTRPGGQTSQSSTAHGKPCVRTCRLSPKHPGDVSFHMTPTSGGHVVLQWGGGLPLSGVSQEPVASRKVSHSIPIELLIPAAKAWAAQISNSTSVPVNVLGSELNPKQGALNQST
jgi:hypothetical protein